MEQSSQNENIINNVECERIMDVVVEKNITTNSFENHDGLQTEASINFKKENEVMKDNFKIIFSKN
jgi:hypothetical protein